MAEAGYPNFDLESWVALYAPAGTPAAAVNQLADAVKRSLDLPESKQRADQAGIEVRFVAPAEMTKILDRDIADWTQAIKAANIKLD
jgi:tripartite-type tricarboxylate transporter receptor subunit TctC